jgi:hypothetical protein
MSVTDLVYRLVGNSGPLASELQKAEKDVQKFNRRATSEIAKLGKAFGAVGAAAAGAFAVMVKSSINTADELTKLSDRAGLAVEDVSALAFVAEQSGTSIQALEKPLTQFQQALLNSGQEGDKFSASLKKIGVETQAADGQLRPTLDVFKDISEQFSQLETGAEKTALASEIFGNKYGPQLVPLLNQGKDGIEALTDQAQRLGLVIDEDTGRAAESFNDNLNVLRKTFTGVANQVASQILPTLVQYSNKAIDGANDTQALAGRVEFISNLFRGLLSIIEVVTGALKLLGNSIGGVAAAIVAAISGDFRGATNIIKELGNDIKTISLETVESVKDIWGDAPPIVQAARATGELAGKTFNNAVESTIRKDLPKKIADPFADATSAITKALEDAARAQDRFIADLEARAARVFAATRTEQERYNQTVAELDQLLNAGVITLDTYTRGLVQAQEALERSSTSADVFTESVEKTEKQVNQFVLQGADRAFDIFADSFFNPMEKGFSGILDSFVKMLQDMALAALKQQVLQAFFGAATGGVAVAAGGGPVGAVASIGSAIAGGLSTRGSALEYHDAGMGSARSGVSTRAQAMTNDVSVTNVNVIDPSMVQQMLMTPQGQRAVLNVVRSSREVIL